MNAAPDTASRAWSWRHAVAKSGLPPTTRHLLLTLSLFMDETGRSCFPSLADLVAATGLSKNTVSTHLEIAAQRGWIEISQHGFRGQRWRRREYVAKWPDRDLISEPILPFTAEEEEEYSNTVEPPAAGEGGSTSGPPSPDEKVGQSPEEGGAIGDPKVGQPLDQDKTSPETTPVTSPEIERETRARDLKATDGRGVKAFLLAWPSAGVDSRLKIEEAWGLLSAEDRTSALEHVTAFLAEFKQIGRGKLPAGWSYLRDRPWEIAREKAAARPTAAPVGGGTLVPPFSRTWWWMLCRRIERGERVGFMIQCAEQNTSWVARKPEELPTEEQERAAVRLSRDSEGFKAWRRFYAGKGAQIPRPDVAEFVWMPGEWPPGLNAEDEAADQRSWA